MKSYKIIIVLVVKLAFVAKQLTITEANELLYN